MARRCHDDDGFDFNPQVGNNMVDDCLVVDESPEELKTSVMKREYLL